jgi:hypothetical protein
VLFSDYNRPQDYEITYAKCDKSSKPVKIIWDTLQNNIIFATKIFS